MYEDKATLLETKKPRNIFNFSLSREQFKLMIIIMLQSITPGMAIGFSAIALPELKLDLNSSTWFASLPTLGSVFGNFMIGYTMDKYGRKKAFLLGTVMAFTGCILLAGPPDILQLFIGQFCVGLSQGAATLPTTVYVAESIAPNNLKFRSSLSSWNVLAINVGICLVYLFGCFFHYNYVALIGAAISFTSTILVLIFIPESPAWLNQKGRFKEAEVARYQLGFKDASIESVSPSYESIEPKDDESLRSYLSKLKRKDVYKPLFITIVFFFFQQYSGTQVFSAYMVDIISVKFLTINPYVLTVISGFILIVGQVTYTVTLPHIGTKKMAIISCVGSGATVLLLAISIALNETANWYSYLLDCIHILAVWFNVFFGAIGIATIPYTIMAEIFPKDAKGLASISVFGVAILYFSILMIYPYMLVVSPYVVYLCFSFVSFTSVIFIYKFIPETVDRTLNEITSDFWR